MKIRLVIDRFEGRMAVCERENGTMVNLPRADLPPTVREGDVLLVDGDSVTVDAKATAERRKKIAEMSKDLWQ